MKPQRMKMMRGSLKTSGTLTAAEPLEQEIARMKRERMPVAGGARKLYIGDDEDAGEEFDFRIGAMDLLRNAMSKAEAYDIQESEKAPMMEKSSEEPE